MLTRLESLYPSEFSQVNQQLCELLAYLESPLLVEKTLALLDEADTTEDKLCYLYTLRNVRIGWTPELRERYFRWLREAEKFPGAVYMAMFVGYIRSEAEAWLDDGERAALGELVSTAPSSDELEETPPPRPLVREWKMEDLLDSLEAAGHGRNFERAQALYTAALCGRCHKLGDRGKPQVRSCRPSASGSTAAIFWNRSSIHRRSWTKSTARACCKPATAKQSPAESSGAARRR